MVLKPGERGLALADFFRVEDGKVVEHWDVIQEVPESAANANGWSRQAGGVSLIQTREQDCEPGVASCSLSLGELLELPFMHGGQPIERGRWPDSRVAGHTRVTQALHVRSIPDLRAIPRNLRSFSGQTGNKAE